MKHHEVDLVETVKVIDNIQAEVEVVEGKTSKFNTNSFNPHKTRSGKLSPNDMVALVIKHHLDLKRVESISN
jgi:hypothetical protein